MVTHTITENISPGDFTLYVKNTQCLTCTHTKKSDIISQEFTHTHTDRETDRITNKQLSSLIITLKHINTH